MRAGKDPSIGRKDLLGTSPGPAPHEREGSFGLLLVTPHVQHPKVEGVLPSTEVPDPEVAPRSPNDETIRDSNVHAVMLGKKEFEAWVLQVHLREVKQRPPTEATEQKALRGMNNIQSYRRFLFPEGRKKGTDIDLYDVHTTCTTRIWGMPGVTERIGAGEHMLWGTVPLTGPGEVFRGL